MDILAVMLVMVQSKPVEEESWLAFLGAELLLAACFIIHNNY